MSVGTYNYRKESRKISLSLLQSIGFQDQGFGDILDKFRIINNRRFHNVTSKYSFPNDEIEIGRMELSHLLLKNAYGSNFSSPVNDKLRDGISVLDVGCGAGHWVIENAKDYPNSTFVGLDMSPIFPTENKPRNAGFIECNVLEGLPFPSNTFDFVHQKFLYAAFSEKQWLQVIKEIARVLKPSGYAEFMEVEPYPLNAGPINKEISEKYVQYHKSNDLCLGIAFKLKDMMDTTKSFGEVKIEKRILAVGKWGGNFGELMLIYLSMTTESSSALMLECSKQKHDKMFKTYFEEFEEYKSSFVYKRFYAQKRQPFIITD
ncbi:16375_t:CDS:2 [Funneliformis geosporum]|uniref:18384_t:CDS:1 n=1 Tax=Funneliformis geosporum TaxID=1117311 RepID=A0A9W4WQ09_9GLOM|nr:18384_t:CDS:2 [Funneliformis geosporum]CAI2182653.1 16375_t:CDS:2 [Funneliformis geosporum]